MRTTRLVVVLALAACGRGDRQATPGTQATASSTAPRGPDQLILRVQRNGGEARVYSYPKLDTVVWSVASAPAPARMLAFDDEAGAVAYVDAKGFPARIDFRQGVAGTVTKTKLTGLASWDGSNIYGINGGTVERHGPSGLWKWKPPLSARAVFPQPDASLLVLAQRGDSSVVWRLRPPATKIVDSVVLSKVDRTLRTQVGDRLYLGSGRELTGVRTRTMQRTTSITFDTEIELLEATPSGDRLFVVTKGGSTVDVVDRYREAITSRIDIGRHAADLRVDPLGRYLLAHLDGVDSTLVIALGTHRVIGTIATTWREDLPFVTPDGGIAAARLTHVVVFDGETLRPKVSVGHAASDFWYPFRWTGFRPRDARLDRPVEFGPSPTDSARRAADSAKSARDSSTQPILPPAAPPTTPAPTPGDTAVRRPSGFTVSFAALLVAEKARDLAMRIRVGSENARVVAVTRDGSIVYRVVLGPYATREAAERVGRESKQPFWVYEGGP